MTVRDEGFQRRQEWLGWVLLRSEYFDLRRLTSYGVGNGWGLAEMCDLEIEGDYYEVEVRDER